jgi:hypothetical protein
MKQNHQEVNTNELGKIVFQKNLEISNLFNEKNQLIYEVEQLREELELADMMKEENQ